MSSGTAPVLLLPCLAGCLRDNQPKFKAQSHARERCAGFCEPVKYVARFPLQITGGRKFVRKGMGIRWGRREGSAFLPDEEQC